MFSNWVSSFTSFRSPKTVLASYLASSLAVYFDVDPHAIEVNLLSDTKIVLHQVRLKPQSLEHHRNLQLTGQVDEIEFSWLWGGDETTSFVRETKLSIRGARFRVVQTSSSPSQPEGTGLTVVVDDSVSNLTPPTTSASSSNEGYIQQSVRQIIDHLTLQISDFELAIEIGLNELVVLQAKSLHLASFGYVGAETFSEGPPLSQRLVLESFGAFVAISNPDTVSSTQYPLLDPFMYAATVQRVSGRRFDGLAYGLDVIGELESNATESNEEKSCGISFHAGTTQVVVLSRLFTMLSPDQDAYTSQEASDVAGQGNSGCGEQGDRDQNRYDDLTSTRFHMSFPGITVNLPNESKIRTPNCTIQYRMDGSVCTVEGTEGILINDGVPLIRLEEGFRWCVDFIRSKFDVDRCVTTSVAVDDEELTWQDALESAEEANELSQSVVASVLWVEPEMKRFIEALNTVTMSVACPDSLSRNFQVETSSVWSVALSGMLAARVEGASQEEYIEARLSSPRVVIGDNMKLLGLKLDELSVESSTFGCFRIVVPHTEVIQGQEEVVVQGTIEASSQTISAFDEVRLFLQRALGLGELEQSEAPFNRNQSELSVSIQLPAITLRVAAPAMNISTHQVRFQGRALHCDRVIYSDESGLSAQVADVVACVDPEFGVKMGWIESLHVPDMVSLGKPTSNVALSFASGTLLVDLPGVELLLAESPGQNHDGKRSFDIDGGALLPFPVRVRLPSLTCLSERDACKGSVRLRSIDFTVAQNDQVISLTSHSSIAIRVENQSGWLDSTLASATVCLSQSNNGFLVSSADLGSIHLGSSSVGFVSIDIPGVTIKSNDQISIDGTVCVSIQSLEVARRLRALVAQFLADQTQSASSTPLPLSLSVPKVAVCVNDIDAKVVANSVTYSGDDLRCARLEVDSTVGTALSVSTVRCTTGAVASVELGAINNLRVQDVLSLDTPVSNVRVVFDGHILHIFIPEAQLSLLPLELDRIVDDTPVDAKAHVGPATASPLVGEMKFSAIQDLPPIPVVLQIQKLGVRHNHLKGTTSIKVFNIDAMLTATKSLISIRNDGDLRIQLSDDDDWLEAVAAGAEALVSRSGVTPTTGSLSSLHVSSSSFGLAAIDIPSVDFGRSADWLSIGGSVTASFPSYDVATRLATFLSRVQLPHSTSSATSSAKTFAVPEVNIIMSESGDRIVFQEIKGSPNRVICDSLHMTQLNGMVVDILGLNCALNDVVTVDLACIKAARLPGTAALEHPVNDVRITCNGSECRVDLPMARVVLLEEEKGGLKGNALAITCPSLSYSAHVNVNDLSVRTSSGKDCFDFQSLSVKCSQRSGSSPHCPGVLLQVRTEEMKTSMMKLDVVRCSATLYEGKTNTIGGFKLHVNKALAVAGFSSVDWKNMFSGESDQQSWTTAKVPFAQMGTLKAHVSYSGMVVAASNSVCIPEFIGGPVTTLNDIMEHVTSSFLKNAPGFLTNAELLGENVCEMTAKGVGRMAAAASLRGAAVGSVAGLVAVDSVRGAITKGKASRNAASDDAYKFGDFTRGTIRSIRQAASNPKGASEVVGSYTVENKSRLAGAGGSGIGMLVGSALLGPVGFVAGAYLGNHAGEKAFGDAPGAKAQTEASEVNRDPNELPRDLLTPSSCLGSSDTVTMTTNDSVDLVDCGECASLGRGSSFQSPVDNFSASIVPRSHQSGPITNQSIAAPASSSDTLGRTHFPMSNVASFDPFAPERPSAASQCSSSVAQPMSDDDWQRMMAPTSTQTVPAIPQHGSQGDDFWSVYDSAPHVPRTTSSFVNTPSSNLRNHTRSDAEQQTRGTPESPQGYRFGDLTRSIVTKGKQKGGRSADDGYKFGDFTRGLFG